MQNEPQKEFYSLSVEKKNSTENKLPGQKKYADVDSSWLTKIQTIFNKI